MEKEAEFLYDTNDRTFNMDEYLNKVGYNWFHLNMVFIISLVFFVEACEMIVINIMLPTIVYEFRLSKIQRSFISSSIFIGYFFGSLVSGSLANKYGRIKIIKIMIIFLFLLGFATGFSPSYFITLFLMRMISGICIGILIPASVILLAECIPVKFRSFVLNLAWIFYPVGIIYICVISMFFIKGNDFQWA